MVSFQMTVQEADFVGTDMNFICTALPHVFINTQTQEVAVVDDEQTYIISTS